MKFRSNIVGLFSYEPYVPWLGCLIANERQSAYISYHCHMLLCWAFHSSEIWLCFLNTVFTLADCLHYCETHSPSEGRGFESHPCTARLIRSLTSASATKQYNLVLEKRRRSSDIGKVTASQGDGSGIQFSVGKWLTLSRGPTKGRHITLLYSVTSCISQLQRRCSCHIQSCRTAYGPYARPMPSDWPMTKQPYAALVCRLMVSTL